MDEDFLDVKENSKKVLGFFIIVIIAIVGGGYFLVFRKFYFSLKTVHLELGESLSTDIKDYVNQEIDNVRDWKIDLSKVNESEVGTYTYTVTYNKTTRKGKVKVSDTTPPVFTLQELVLEEGSEEFFLGDFLATCEDYSKPCLVSLKNSKDEEKFGLLGEHSIDLVIADLYGNKSSAEGKLKVLEKGSYVDSKSLDLEYASNSRGTDDFKGKRFISFEKALRPDSGEVGAEINKISLIDLNQYVKTNYEGYRLVESEIIELYNKHGYVIGYSVELKISGEKEKIVYVDKEKVPGDTAEKNEDEVGEE